MRTNEGSPRSRGGGDGQTILEHSPHLKNYATYVFVLLFLLYMFDYIDRLVVTSLFPFLERDLKLNDVQSGALVSAVYWTIVVFTFPVSILVDRWSRRSGIGIMVVVWSIATAVCALTKSFGQLLFARAAVGFGEAGYAPGGNALISGIYPSARRAFMIGVWTASIPLGSAIGTALGGFIGTRWGWHSAFGIVAIPGFIIGLLFLFTVRDYKTVALVRQAETGSPPRKMRGREMVNEFATKPTLLLSYVGFACNTFVSAALLTWLPTYFHRTEGLLMDRASFKASVVLLLAIVGAPLGGLLADAWRRRRPNARLLLSSITSAVSAIVLFIAFGFLHGTAQFSVLLLGGLLVIAYVSAIAAVVEDVVHPGLWAISYSIAVVVQNLLGSSLGPIVVGALSDARGIANALTILPVFTLAAGALFFAASLFYDRDAKKVDRVRLEMGD